jgi:hypothetical protein
LKKSGILLAALLLSTFTLASSAYAQAAPVPAAAAVHVAQASIPLPDFLTAPAVQTPDLTLAKGATGMEWLGGVTQNFCSCKKNSDCGSGPCCWWPHQKCGICCPP